MPFAWTTYLNLRNQLAQRLSDPSKIFYVDSELGLYLQESLRVWNAYSQMFRGKFVFTLTASQPFYDLSVPSTSIVRRTLTDRNLVNDMQYNLMETVNDFSVSSTWAGTGMFGMDDLVSALQRRRDQFLLETGMVLTQSEINAPAPPAGRVPLSDSIIDVRRAAWLDTPSGAYSTIWRSDEHMLNSLIVGWQNNAELPQTFSTFVAPPVTIQLGPISNNVGKINLVTVNAGAALNVAAGVVLGLQDDWCWPIKYGALADLLGKDGQARDPERQPYCQQRWTEGVEVAKLSASVLNVIVDGQQLPITTLQNLDTMRPNWQNTTAGTPDIAAMAGQNLLILNPTPDAGPHSVELDVVRNAPIPSADGDQVQISHEQADVILDYAQHIACFKLGGAEFQATFPLFANLRNLAMDHNSRLREQATFAEYLREQGRRNYRQQPMREEDAA